MDTCTLQGNVGNLPPHRVKASHRQQQERLRNLARRYRDSEITMQHFLNGVGHNIRLG